MTTLEMEYALMKSHVNIRQQLCVPNVSWGASVHECDLLYLTTSDYAVEIEIKVSKADLKKDIEKGHAHISNLIRKLYFAVPEKLMEAAIDLVPQRAGILIVYKDKNPSIPIRFKYKVREIRSPRINSNARKWTIEERSNLGRLGTMRILGLKEKLVTNYLTRINKK